LPFNQAALRSTERAQHVDNVAESDSKLLDGRFEHSDADIRLLSTMSLDRSVSDGVWRTTYLGENYTRGLGRAKTPSADR
jgi:hypothetical protein